MGLRDAVGSGPVCVDTAPFIYLLERHVRYLPVVRPLFEAADRGDVEIVTSGVTLLEVLLVPFRADDQATARRYEQLLTTSRGVRLLDLGVPLLRLAAELRARHGIATPDALQLAAGLTAGCTALVTNDRRLPDIPGLPVLQLSDFEPTPPT